VDSFIPSSLLMAPILSPHPSDPGEHGMLSALLSLLISMGVPQ